jgi:zinc and cadmium transporter
MSILAYILISVFIVSLISFIGAVTLFLQQGLVQELMFVFVSFASGAMLGAAFLDLLPEAIAHSPDGVFVPVLVGIVTFFIFENFLSWYHCHSAACERHTHATNGHAHHKHVKKPFTYLNLFGDGIHNFTDGVAMAIAYLVNVPLGIVTTIAIICHEIPQELGDFGLLIYGGFKPGEALLWNFISALTAVAGAVLAYFFATSVPSITPYLVPFAAGGFIYIATVDLLPELHKTTKLDKAAIQLLFFLLGIGVIWAVIHFFEH